MHKRLSRPDRVHRVPSQFSWSDHRLVREHHIGLLGLEGRALYLCLLTVTDAERLSVDLHPKLTPELHLFLTHYTSVKPR